MNVEIKDFDLNFKPFVDWKTQIDNKFPDRPEYYLEDIPGMMEYLVELFLNQNEWFEAVTLISKKLNNEK